MNETQPHGSNNTESNGEIAASERPDTETSHEQEPTPKPLIYVACLSAYNNGYLHGVWLDAAREAEAIHNDIQAMLVRSPMHRPEEGEVPEEFAIHDYEDFGNCQVHEYDSIELVSKIARGIVEHGYAFAAWADVNEGEPELFDHFATAYVGHYESLESYVQQTLDDRDAESDLARLLADSNLADLQSYITIDAKALAQDMSTGGDINVYRAPTELGGGVWLFDERA